MSIKLVPTLSSVGWAKTPIDKLDMLFADFIVNDAKDSTQFGDLPSLPYLLQKSGSDKLLLKKNIEEALATHLEDAFDQVVLEVGVEELATDDSKLRLRFFISVTEDGVSYNFAKSIRNKNSSSLTVMEILNE